MENNTQLTNVPDYQKIMQTSHSQSAGGSASNAGAEWNEEVKTLMPSPVVRHPTTGSPRDLHTDHYWGEQQHSSIPAKASWEAQPNYSSSTYNNSNSQRNLSFTNAESSPYLNQGYPQSVTKYIDSEGVERRIVRRNLSSVAGNRRSFTEGFMLNGDTNFATFMGGGKTLKNASSQKNLVDYSSPSQFKRDVIRVTEMQPEQRHQEYSQTVFVPKNSRFSGQGEDQWKEIGGNPTMAKTPQEDLRHWQQQHQEELLHQHLETQALYETPGNQGLLGSDTKGDLTENPPARWEPVRRAADNIIREKNMIIEKLKTRILELEEDYKVTESKLRQAIMCREDNDLLHSKLQELQHKNTSLKERMNEERSKRNSEMDDLEIKLGSVEHELQQTKDAFYKKDEDYSDLEEQLLEKSREAEAWRSKFDESRGNLQDMKKKLDGLQTYLNELPTVEESRVQLQQVLRLEEDNSSMKSRCEELDRKLRQVRKVVTTRDFRIHELEEREQELEDKIAVMNQEIAGLRDSDGSKLFNIQAELGETQGEKARLETDLDKAKKLLETAHMKLRQLEMKYQSDVKTFETHAGQDEATVMSLRAEIEHKDEQMEKMKKTMKELGSHNQELLEQSLLVREQVRNMENKGSEISTDLQRRLILQIGMCYSELDSLVQVCSGHARGEDPDISVLLGVKGLDIEEEQGATALYPTDGKTMTQWLSKLGELRRDIDKLRARICNKYAEDMGDNMNCATQ